MVKTTVYLDEEVYEKLRKISFDTRVPVTEILRQYIQAGGTQIGTNIKRVKKG